VSKGSYRRRTDVAEDDFAEKWERCFGRKPRDFSEVLRESRLEIERMAKDGRESSSNVGGDKGSN